MADSVQLELDWRSWARTLRLAESKVNAALARALEKTSFDVLDALRSEALSAFSKATPRGKQYVGGRGSFQFKLDRAALVSTITPGPNPPERGAMLAEHERGAMIFETEQRLGLGEANLLAIPINEAALARSRSGRVPKRIEPAQLLKPEGRGFLAMRGDRGVLLQRRGGKRGSSRAVALYAIVPRAQLPRIFRWMSTIRDRAEASLPIKVREQIAKITAR